MLHRNRRNPFRRAPKSPFNEDGPNSQSLKRGLEWLERRDRDTPSHETSIEIRKQSEKVPMERSEESAKPASESQPEQTVSVPRKEASQTETAKQSEEGPKPDTPAAENNESEKQTVEAKPATEEPAQTEAPKNDAANTELTEREIAEPKAEEEVEPAETEADRTELTETDVTTTELANIEAARIEEAEIRKTIYPSNIRTLDRRRFPRRDAQAIDLVKHERYCTICQHPQRESIEEAFLDWRRSTDIRYEFELPNRSCIYRHAHAFGLFQLRTRNMRLGLENIIEESSHCVVTAESVIRAIRAHSCLDENGRWIEPPRRVIISRETLPKQPKTKRKSAKRRVKGMRATPRRRDAYLTLSTPTDLRR